MHEVVKKQKIAFSQWKLEGHALAWWESDAMGRALENEPLVTNWEVFKDMIKAQFHPIEYEENQQIV